MCTTGQRKRWQSCASFEAQTQATGCLHQMGPTDEPAMAETDGQPFGSPETTAPDGFPSPESWLLKNQCLCSKGVGVNTSWYSPLCLGFLGVAASSFPQLSLVFLCKKKKVMNLGFPQPTAEMAGCCLVAGIPRVKPATRVSGERWHCPIRLCQHRSSAEALRGTRHPPGRRPHEQAETNTEDRLTSTTARCLLQTHQAPSAPGRGGAQTFKQAQEGGQEEVLGYKKQASRREDPPSDRYPLLFGNQQFLILCYC